MEPFSKRTLSTGQFANHCVPDHGGALVLHSGTIVPFANCQQTNGNYVVETSAGPQTVYVQNVAGILVGGDTQIVRANLLALGGFGGLTSNIFAASVVRTRVRRTWANYQPNREFRSMPRQRFSNPAANPNQRRGMGRQTSHGLTLQTGQMNRTYPPRVYTRPNSYRTQRPTRAPIRRAGPQPFLQPRRNGY